METQASVAKGATSLYIANVIVLLGNTVYFLILTNVLRSTIDVGIVTALNIVIWLLVTICILAQPVVTQSPIPAPLAVLKFIPQLVAKRSSNDVSRVFRASMMFAGAIGALLAGILIAWPSLLIPLVGGEEVSSAYVQVSAIDVLALSLGQVCLGALIALGDTRRASIYIILWSVLRYAIASVLLVPYSILGVLVGWMLGDTLLLLLALQRATREIPRHIGSSSFSLINMSRYSLYTLFSALLGFSVNQADKIFTLAHQGLSELAIYNVAIVAASFTAFAPYALLTVLLPALSALHSANRDTEMCQTIRAYTRYVAIIVTPVAIGFASVTEVALRIFGPEYTAGLAPSIIVSVATGLTGIGAVYAAAVLATGQLKWYTAANVLGVGCLIAAALLLTQPIGLAGPALGRGALMAVATVVYAVATWRNGFLELDLKAYLSSVGGSAIMGTIVFGLLSVFPSFTMKLAVLPLAVVVGAGIYLVSLRLARLLNASDLEFVRQILPSRFHPLLPRIGRLAGIKLTE